MKETDNITITEKLSTQLRETDNTLYLQIKEILNTARKKAYSAVNFAMVEAYWLVGKQIVEAQDGNERAEYGSSLLKYLSERLTNDFGKGFTVTNLTYMRQFYLIFPIRHALRDELAWTHYRLIMKAETEQARNFYIDECIKSNWSTRQLERQINTHYYERLISSQNKALITHIQHFLLELGRGFAFEARQKRISFDGEHFYIDLVFYNYILKCFVLIDLKTGKLTHQDIGQMQMYVNYYTHELMNEGDNPPIGIILCADKSESVVRYTLPENNKQIFTSKYKLYLPTEEELCKELENEKNLLMQESRIKELEGEGHE